MLDINMECRKGILFIRLGGELTKETVGKLNTEVTELVKEAGIRNIVFNVENLISMNFVKTTREKVCYVVLKRQLLNKK